MKQMRWKCTDLLVQYDDHVREAGKLEQNKEYQLTRQMLPQLNATRLVGILVAIIRQTFVLFWSFHRQNDQINKLVLKCWTSLFHLKSSKFIPILQCGTHPMTKNVTVYEQEGPPIGRAVRNTTTHLHPETTAVSETRHLNNLSKTSNILKIGWAVIEK